MRALISPDMSPKCRQSLERLGVSTIVIPPYKKLPRPIESHPDILLFGLTNGIILTGREYYEENGRFFDSLGVKIILDEKTPRGEYPSDVLFDALSIGDTLYGKEGFVSERLIAAHKRTVWVKQGYARCSVALLSESCAVTADKGLYTALTKDGLDVLLVSSGGIALEGYGYGFIGGAGGRISEDTYVFFGDLLSHPDGRAIMDFALEHKINAVSLTADTLSDHGGLLII